MTYFAPAVLALALAALSSGPVMAQSMATPGPTPNSWVNAVPGIGPMTATENVRNAQERLRAIGLYYGPIDGRLDAGTRTAIAAFQQRYGLPRTATLDRATFAWLMNSDTAVGYGSSTPPAEAAPMASPGNPQAPIGAGGMTTGGAMMAR